MKIWEILLQILYTMTSYIFFFNWHIILTFFLSSKQNFWDSIPFFLGWSQISYITKDQTQGSVHATQTLYNWATSSAL